MAYTLDQLPNPHLGEFLDPSFEITPRMAAIIAEHPHAATHQWKKLPFHDHVELWELRRAHLRACHLPLDYDDLNDDSKRLARFGTLRSWYNRSQPNVVVSHLENMIAATYLWVEEYVKPSEMNQGAYYNRDPSHKYDMVRAAFSPPVSPGEPTKTLITAPRGSTKTRTLIGQVVPMIACCRPNTEILVSEINKPRTLEETTAIMREIEGNEFIQRDFGGKGVLYPTTSRGTLKWSSSCMDFIHQPSCAILGISWNSKQRGRHPCMWIIDDPEDPTHPMNAEERKTFWTMLFRRGLPMLTKGNIFLWISTLILGGCCHQAMQGAIEGDEDLKGELSDIRFDDWNLCNFDLLKENDEGEVESIYPDYISVEQYAQKEEAYGKRDVMAEYRGIATAAGAFVFHREQFGHHYMHCERDVPGGKEEYFFDLMTGEQMPWNQFLEGLYVGQATDIANGTSRDSDYGACVVAGVDAKQFPTFYILDAYLAQVISDKLVWRSYEMAGIWKSEKAAWEVGSMQNVVVRYASQYAKKSEEMGYPVPKMVTIVNHSQQKNARIIATLRILYANKRIRFPWFEPVVCADGITHYPAENLSKKYLKLLYSQLDMFTDEGPSGADDGPDALQMCIRMLKNNRGTEVVEENTNGEELKKWSAVGVEWSREQMDIESWTPEMLEACMATPELNDMDIYD